MTAPRQFVATSEHARFEEFCEACQRERYIGLCFGSPGVGKTVSARQVARAAEFESLRPPFSDHPDQLAALHGLKTLLYTPDVINGPRAVTDQVLTLWNRLLFVDAASRPDRRRAAQDDAIDSAHQIVGGRSRTVRDANRKVVALEESMAPDAFLHPLKLLIVDEADRLKNTSLEQVRHLFDRGAFGLVLIGMPGLEKRLARYPQLYSRVGFVHHYRPLPIDEMRSILEHAAERLVATPPTRGLTDPAVMAELLRITGGNRRLVVRLLTQVRRILEVNDTDVVTVDVVDAAREVLVIGTG